MKRLRMSSNPQKSDSQKKRKEAKYSDIFNDRFLKEFLQTLPYATAILDEENKIILANKVKLDGAKDISVEEFFGHSPGSALNCIHARNPGGPCHNEGVCKFCGLPNALLLAQKQDKKIVQETNITIELADKTEKSYDVELHASPFPYNDEKFILLTIIDISEQKRKRALERIFFHDVINKIGSLQNIIEMLTDKEYQEEKEELTGLSKDIIKDLNEEILQQKNLMAAESGDLEIHSTQINTREIIEESISQLVQYPDSQNIKIEISPDTPFINFSTDPVILKRILINMLKNAIEASKTGNKVIIGSKEKDRRILFWVQNYSYIPENNQIKIFDRTYSTKGKDRGLGTYSMKLLGEQYLKGKVFFTTGRQEGTTFYIDLPEKL
ncbi:MAG: sensor histidine kinase [Bacteroidota bacterium]